MTLEPERMATLKERTLIEVGKFNAQLFKVISILQELQDAHLKLVTELERENQSPRTEGGGE